MTIPGGGTDKVGNRYELRWTVRQFIRLLRDEASWIHLEPVGASGEKVEFLLGMADGRIEAHQVKRQQAGKGHWTTRELASVGVIQGLRKHGVDGNALFVFMSTQAAKSLPELKLRAYAANGDPDAFETSLSMELSGELAELRRQLGQTDTATAFKALRNSRWENSSEDRLGDEVLALLGAYVTGDPEQALGCLAMYALDAVHRRIIAADLWAELKCRGIGPSELARDQGLAASISEQTREFLDARPCAIGDLRVPRTEAERCVSALLEPTAYPRVVLLEGAAGTGKSGVVAQILERITAAGWPLLPIRLDALDPTQRPAEIGRQVLGRDKSPVSLLAGSAAGRRCLLVVDQLDAVSIVSGRSPEMFNAVDAMAREAKAHPNLTLLLVCRSFDLEHDHRLRGLARPDGSSSLRLPIGAFDQATVGRVLRHLGIDPRRLSAHQRSLLTLPLHLALLAGVVSGRSNADLGFDSVKALYDAYWQQKRTAVLPLLADQNAFETLLYGLCDAMSERQALAVPRGLLPAGDADLDRLLSANLLTREGSRIRFFHEGFFDYVFARRFCTLGESLLSFLLATEQDLFRRSQVRQILLYRRDDDFDVYIDDLRICLADAKVRFHIKRLAIGVMALAADPRPEEWAIFADQLADPESPLGRVVLDALWSSTAWFRFLAELGVVADWLRSPKADLVDFAFNWLRRQIESAPELAADLLEAEAGRSGERDQRILAIAVSHGAAACSSRIEALFHRLATADGRDWSSVFAAYGSLIDSNSYGGEAQAQIASRALAWWLRLIAKDAERARSFALDRDGPSALREGISHKLAESSPVELAASILEPVLELLEQSTKRDGDPPYSDPIWAGGFHEWSHWGPEALLSSLVAALRRCATDAPELYRSAIDRLSETDFKMAHAIVLRAMLIEGMDTKAVALPYLVGSWSRWGIWYDRQAHWDCRLLLASLAPHLSAEDVATLEPTILVHWEKWEPWAPNDETDCLSTHRRQARWHRAELGMRQFMLLGVLPERHLSAIAHRRLAELTRKADSVGWELEKPWGTRGGTVIRPLPGRAVHLMNDAQWLSAIRRHDNDEDKEWLSDRVIGGARELAHALEERAKTQPERFARLLLVLPADAHEAYFGALTRGLTGGALSENLLTEVADRIHHRPGQPHGRWLPRLIASHGADRLPVGLLDIVAWYATQSPDPSDEVWRDVAADKQPLYGGDPRFHGINTVRGSAALAIAELIAEDRHYWERFAPILKRMVEDASVAVRTCVADALTQALRYDRPAAIRLFLRLCDTDDILLADGSIERFLYYAGAADFDAVRPVLERMAASPLPGARHAAARQATVAALSDPSARALADLALRGDAHHRKGAAEVLVANVLRASDRDYAHAGLSALFADEDPEVRRAAGGWLHEIEDDTDLAEIVDLLDAYAESPAIEINASALFRSLQRMAAIPPVLLLRVGRRFIQTVGTDAANTAGTNAFAAETLSELILRAYQQAERDADIRRQCLDLFDQMLEVGGYGADRVVESVGR